MHHKAQGSTYIFQSDVVKIYPFANLSCVNKDENMQPNKFSQLVLQYFPQLLKTNLLSRSIVSRTQPSFVCSNSAVITVE